MGTSTLSMSAYEARNSLNRKAFADLQSACLRLGSQLTYPFLFLDKSIDNFAGPRQWKEMPTAGLNERQGVTAGLTEQLDSIYAQADHLRAEGAREIKRCNKELVEINRQLEALGKH
jgi:hypothetical protein